MFTPTTMLKV